MIPPKYHPEQPVSFYAIIDTLYVEPSEFASMTAKVLEGEPDLVQIRAKDCTTGQRRALLEAVYPLFTGSGFDKRSPRRLIINDDARLCHDFPDIGLHIGQEDLPPAEAREWIGPDRLLGLSTHSLEQAREAMAARDLLDYFAVGPIFATPTKPEANAVSLALLNAVAAENPPLPFYAIGGINLANASTIRGLGAPGLVAVSEVLKNEDPASVIRQFRKIVPPPAPLAS